MKTMLIILSSVIITIVSLKRLLVAESPGELAFGAILSIVFGTLSVYLIFEKTFKSMPVFKKYENFISTHRLVVNCITLIVALLLIEALFLSYTPENPLLNILRLSLMLLFLVGIIIFLIQIFLSKREKNISKL
jgi:hypothetical protein